MKHRKRNMASEIDKQLYQMDMTFNGAVCSRVFTASSTLRLWNVLAHIVFVIFIRENKNWENVSSSGGESESICVKRIKLWGKVKGRAGVRNQIKQN